MERLTRVEAQERNRARVLAAAREEFAARGFRDAKIDAIADRAGLTRGAVYSNFPGKRALYFSVLAAMSDSPGPGPADPGPAPAGDAGEALGALARAWVARLPLATDEHGDTLLGRDLMPEILAEDRTRHAYAQLLKLDAVLLGLALERLRPAGGPAGGPAARQVRLAEAVLTTLHGAGQLAAAAPGFVEPFDVVTVCRELAGLDLGGGIPPLPAVTPPRAVDEPWSPPPATDAVRRSPAGLSGDGVVAVLGLRRLQAAEEAVRAAPPGTPVTAVVVT
ncbi:TetR/AcrR family transcriptional regulator, partial [Sphaerisporangium rubeum]